MDRSYGELFGQTILIVDDQMIPALNMQLVLEATGAETVVARGPHELASRGVV